MLVLFNYLKKLVHCFKIYIPGGTLYNCFCSHFLWPMSIDFLALWFFNNFILRTVWYDSVCSIKFSLKSLMFPYNCKVLGSNFSNYFCTHLLNTDIFARLPGVCSAITVALDLAMWPKRHILYYEPFSMCFFTLKIVVLIIRSGTCLFLYSISLLIMVIFSFNF